MTTFDWSVLCGNSRSNSNLDNFINSDRRNVYINFLEYFYILKIFNYVFIFNINIFDTAMHMLLAANVHVHVRTL